MIRPVHGSGQFGFRPESNSTLLDQVAGSWTLIQLNSQVQFYGLH